MNLTDYNLDYQAAKHAQNLLQKGGTKAKEFENTLTKTLGVLQENGVYASFLYLYAREKENGEKLAAEMLALLHILHLPAPPEGASRETVLQHLAENLTTDLSALLLAHEALERMLIYARYHAKAQQKEKE